MREQATIVVKLVKENPPVFKVLYVNHHLISQENLAVGEELTDTDLDTLFEFYGDFGVEVLYR